MWDNQRSSLNNLFSVSILYLIYNESSETMRDRVEWEQERKAESGGLGGEKVHGILFTRKIQAENKYLRWELGSGNEQMLAQLQK